MAELQKVQVPAARLSAWLSNFERRHGDVEFSATAETFDVAAGDGATASFDVPWLPWIAQPTADAFIGHVQQQRQFGVILARKTAHAVGIVVGTQLIASSVDTHYVQGRTKAGGWSQQRYARRRSNQARASFESAAKDAAAILLPRLATLDFLVCGGEQTAIKTVLAEPMLAPLVQLRARSPQRVWPTADPRKAVLIDFVETFQSVSVRLNELA